MQPLAAHSALAAHSRAASAQQLRRGSRPWQCPGKEGRSGARPPRQRKRAARVAQLRRAESPSFAVAEAQDGRLRALGFLSRRAWLKAVVFARAPAEAPPRHPWPRSSRAHRRRLQFPLSCWAAATDHAGLASHASGQREDAASIASSRPWTWRGRTDSRTSIWAGGFARR